VFEFSWVCDAVLAGGATVHVRPIYGNDARRLVAFHSRLSPESIYMRFFGPHPNLASSEVDRFTQVDGHDRMALVATVDDEIVGVARYDRLQPKSAEAEVAFVVDDAHQGRGLGSLLLEQLAAYARNQGIEVFRAETLPHNRPMLEVFRRAGFVEYAHLAAGVVDVRMEIGHVTPLSSTHQVTPSVLPQQRVGALERDMLRTSDSRAS
jgi:RimJ/RimL family protein N-acetyltransferase